MELPEGWKIEDLGDAVDVLDNLRKPVNSTERQGRIAGKSTDQLYPYYGATGQVGWIDRYLTDGEYILVGEDGAPFLDLFKSKAYKIKGKTWVNNHAHILKGKPNITLNDFVLYYLNSINYREYVNGTTRLKLTKGSLVGIPFPVPSITEQHRIVDKIEELFSELDKGIENLKTAQQQLKVYRQAVLKWAFEGKLTNENVKDGELPEGWEWVELGQLMESVKNGHSKKPDDKGEFKILRISAVRPNSLNMNDVRYLEKTLGEQDSIQENDLLFTRYNGSIDFVGVCARVPKLNEKMYYPDKLIRCRALIKEPYHSAYIAYAANSHISRQYILSKIKTTAGQKIEGHPILLNTFTQYKEPFFSLFYLIER